MPLIVQSSSTKLTCGRGRNQDPITKQFLTGTLEKCPSCGSDAKMRKTYTSKKTGAYSRYCTCKSCGLRFIAVVGIRPSDINPNYAHKASERIERKDTTCKTCEHWWGGKCEKGETLAGCKSYELSV